MDAIHQNVQIPAAGVVLEAEITLPDPARGLVLVGHGSGSSRHSPRNRFMASHLQGAGLATVLADLLTEEEERRDALTFELRFDIELLATRLAALTDWLVGNEHTAGLGLGLLGASTGAAAMLVAAEVRPAAARAVVCRGGRPDLAGEHLPQVRQPVLLIVGGRDSLIIDLNRKAMKNLGGQARLVTIPGATPLVEEPGALEERPNWPTTGSPNGSQQIPNTRSANVSR